MKTIGKYRVVGVVGRGAMGEVLAAEDPDIGRRVAIKVMVPSGEASHQRFAREARIIGRLSHPNIVVVHDFGVQDERPYLVMELLDGIDLKQWLESPHPLPQQARIIADLCAAVTYAHSQGVLHRDIKPANVQVLPSGHGKLMDFGVARGEVSDLTASGAVLGTLIYMAPEILSNNPPTPSSDIYAVGMICYEMLTGTNPFVATSLAACLNLVLHETAPRLRECRPDLPTALSDAVMACIAKDPGARAPNLDQLAAIATAIANGSTSAEPPPGTAVSQSDPTTVLERPPTASRQKRRRRPLLGLAAVVATFIGLAAGARLTGLWPIRPTSPHVPPPLARPTSGVPTRAAGVVTAPQSAETPGPARQARPEPAPTTPTGAVRPAASHRPTTTPSPTRGPPTPLPTATAAPATIAAPHPTLPPSATDITVPVPPPPTATAPREDTPTPTVAPPRLMLTAADPHSFRAGRAVRLRLTGSGFHPDMQVEVLRGRRVASGFELSRVLVLDANHIEIDMAIDRDIPLGGYALVVVTADGHRSNRLEVDVNL